MNYRGSLEYCDELYYQQNEDDGPKPSLVTPATAVFKKGAFHQGEEDWQVGEILREDQESGEGEEVVLPSVITNTIKNIVSKNKKRFVWDDFDLDLAYITDNIIAMGFPSQNIEAMYRNSLREVESFLALRHPKHYRVYNLCSERKYSKQKFEGSFVEFPFEDHNSPPFQLIFKCCMDMKEWLDKDKENVAAIHCKAGKGRTGLIVCCYLLFSNFKSTAQESLNYYGETRTHDGKGVTIKSQRRYIKYFQQALKQGMDLEKYMSIKRKSKISKVKITSAPQIHFFGGGCTPWVHILSGSYQYKSKYTHELVTYKVGQQVEMLVTQPFNLTGDFKLTFYSKGQFLNKSEEFMRVWLNLKFITDDVVEVPALEIDGVKASDGRFNMSMKIIIYFKHQPL